jgi:hypothetical protein
MWQHLNEFGILQGGGDYTQKLGITILGELLVLFRSYESCKLLQGLRKWS